MEVDQQIRQLVEETLAPLDDVTTARREVSRRAVSLRHRRQWVRVAAVATAVATGVVAAVGALLWLQQPGDMTPPVIAPTPDGSPGPSPDPNDAVAVSCDGLSISDRLETFLDTWTTGGTSLLVEACVLPGRHGPAPRFDTSGLGVRRSLFPGDLPDSFELAPTGPFRQRASGYPLVHLGHLEDAEHPLFLDWQLDETGTPVACVQGTCPADEIPGSEPGVFGIGRGGSHLVMTAWTLPEASVVSLEINGDPVVWQRPVARIAHLFIDDYQPRPDTSYRVVVLDSEGRQIASYQGTLDL